MCSLRAAICQMMKRLVAVKCLQHPEGFGVLPPLRPRAGATLLFVYLTEYSDDNTQVKTLYRGAVSWLLDLSQPHSGGTVSANRQDGGSAPAHEGTGVKGRRKRQPAVPSLLRRATCTRVASWAPDSLLGPPYRASPPLPVLSKSSSTFEEQRAGGLQGQGPRFPLTESKGAGQESRHRGRLRGGNSCCCSEQR